MHSISPLQNELQTVQEQVKLLEVSADQDRCLKKKVSLTGCALLKLKNSAW